MTFDNIIKKKASILEKYIIFLYIIIVPGIILITYKTFISETNQVTEVYLVHEKKLFNNDNNINYENIGNETCWTFECLTEASRILTIINQSADPCQDFYQFSCGNFLKNTPIPKDEHVTLSLSKNGEILLKRIRNILSKPIDPRELSPFKSLKNIYRGCMNTKTIEEQGLNVLKDILKEVGGWPVIEGDGWNDSNFDWIQMIHKLRNIGLSTNSLFTTSIGINLTSATDHVLHLSLPTLGLYKNFLIRGLENEFVSNYYDYMVDVAETLGADRKKAEYELKDSLNFEINLAKISLQNWQNIQFVFKKLMSISELQTKLNEIPWLDYLNNIINLPNVKLKHDDIIFVQKPEYIHNLLRLIKNTPNRILANYIIWRGVENSIEYLNEEIRNKKHKYLSKFDRFHTKIPRWRECLLQAVESLPIAAGSIYVRNYFPPKSKGDVLLIVNNIRNELFKLINESVWMDQGTKYNALNKVTLMTNHIGYPDEILDDYKISKFYKNLNVDSNHYFWSIRKVNLFNTANLFDKLWKPVNKNDWTLHANVAEMNAFYSTNENSIDIPAGILQQNVFSNERPNYMNYGSIGFIIGHEIIHGFDTTGIRFDQNGHMKDWWNPNTLKIFKQKTQCIIEQYNQYTIPQLGVKINGTLTLEENMADIYGTKIAYNSYKNWAKTRSKEQKLPGLDYTPNQMFWISSAIFWCAQHRLEDQLLEMTTDTHSPPYFRVLGSLRNNEDFSRDFKCPLGSEMNPVKKCTIW